MGDTVDLSPRVIYTFRFGWSDKIVELTREQVDNIPYLTGLIAHKDDFLWIENEDGEYVLNDPIKCNWFMAILHWINTKNAYNLFDELAEDENILDVLQLFDYLDINSFPLPLLKTEDLVLLNPIDIKDKKS